MSTFTRVERRETLTSESVWREGIKQPTITTTMTYVTRYRVSGIAAVTAYDTIAGRSYVPVAVSVARTGRGPSSVAVSGLLQRKDGSVGTVVHQIHRYTYRRTDWPAWLIEIVEDSER